jgi:ATP-dependent DNA helicase RecG
MDLKKIIFQDESKTVEFKKSPGESKEIIKTISAFSNTKGGRIFVGVSNSGKVLSVEIGKDTIERLANQISTLRISKDEYERLILEKHKDKLYFDSQICKEATLADIDNIKVKRFLERASFERRLDINPDINPKETLEKLNLIKKDKLTNAAILLFGKNPQKFFLQAETRCARFKGTEPLEFIDMKVFGGNIIDQRED